ncbi:hypothetical protein [Enterococcus plantarum]|nr:hypothetical protein [Enterococcus plantarum]
MNKREKELYELCLQTIKDNKNKESTSYKDAQEYIAIMYNKIQK